MAGFFEPSRGSYDPSFARSEPAGDPFAGLAPPPAAPAGPTVAPIGFDETSRQVFVNGRTFNADDHDSALNSVAELDKPLQSMPSNFRPMSPDEYGGYINRIKDPSIGRLAKKNFGIGVDTSQQLAGSALKFFGAEETGQKIIDQQTEDIRFNQPYQRAATDIDSAGGAGEWFVANAAQMAPLMAEMLITSALTAGVGGVAAGASATGAKFLARGAVKNLASDAGKGLRILQGGGKLAKGSAELNALRRAGQISGAKLGAVAAAEGVAIGDIYQAVEESGNYDSPTLARLATLVASVPYAAAEVIPAAMALKVAGKALRSGGRGRRLATGALQGAAVEGSAETVQDMLSLGTAGELDFNDPEVRNQLINAFAAGAGIGGPLGGVANAIRGTAPDASSTPEPEKPRVDTEREESDMLNPGKQGEMFPDSDLGAPPVGLQEGQVQGELFPDVRPEGAPTIQQPGQMELNLQDPRQGELDLQQPPTVIPMPDGTVGEPAFTDAAQGDLFTPREEFVPTEDVAPTVVPFQPPPGQLDLFNSADIQSVEPGSDLRTPESTQLELPLNDTRQGELDLRAPVPPSAEAMQFGQDAVGIAQGPVSEGPYPASELTPQADLFPVDTPQGDPDVRAFAGAPTGFQGISTNERTIDIPRMVRGKEVTKPVEIRQALESSEQRIGALEALATCLKNNR